MDNDVIGGLLKYEPPWRVELVKWQEGRQSQASLSSVASAAVTSVLVEPGQDISR